MANVTRIKASDPAKDKPEQEQPKPPVKAKKVEEKAEPTKAEKKPEAAKSASAEAKKTEFVLSKDAGKTGRKTNKPSKDKTKKPFILIRPFVALGTYLRDSWREIRQVRWPNRKATWKMVLAVIIYTAVFVLLISLLDLFFTWLFSLILGN